MVLEIKKFYSRHKINNPMHFKESLISTQQLRMDSWDKEKLASIRDSLRMEINRKGHLLLLERIEVWRQILNALKNGIRTIYNHDNTIAYTGCFVNGLPNGEGYTVNDGNFIYWQLNGGIDIISST